MARRSSRKRNLDKVNSAVKHLEVAKACIIEGITDYVERFPEKSQLAGCIIATIEETVNTITKLKEKIM